MKTKIKQVMFAVAILSVFSLGFFANANNASAQYTVQACDSATITGTVITGTPPAHARFEYGTNYNTVASGGGIKTDIKSFDTEGNFPVSQFISGLSENTTYYYRLAVTNDYGTVDTSINNFTTSSCGGTTTPPTTAPTATITSTSSCTAPCNALVSWTSAGLAPTTLKIYKNGTFIWNQIPNVSDSATDWGLSQGTYRYCARAENANWTSETGDLACSTTTVNAATVTPTPTQNTPPSATITSTASCTAPCNVQVSWSSANVATTIKFYRNGTYIWNQTPNISGSQTDWAVSQGTYRYCVRAVNADWTTETGDLACSTTTVGSPAAVASPTATITSTASCTAPCNVQVSWTTANVATTTKFYKNGTYLWNQTPNISGSQTDWAVPQGTYRYCIHAVNADWVTETADLACSTTTVNGGGSTLTMSGTLTPATSNCVITSGQNSCNINFTWNTINPVATSAVTSAGITVANGNSGSSSFAIPFGSKAFYLYNNSILLDQKTVSASCASGTTWNGGTCQTSTTTTQTCQDLNANNYGGTLPCTYQTTTQTCQDSSANNYHGALPCTYSQSSSAGTNFVYGTNTNTNTSTGGTSTNTNTSTGGTSTNTNTYTNNNPITNTNNNNPVINVNVNGGGSDNIVQTCRDTTATNYGGTLPCNYYYAPQVCQDVNASNYRGTLPCVYYNTILTCQDPNAINYRSSLPCTYYNNTVLTCQDPNAINYRGILPCTYQNIGTGQQPTVVVFANKTSVPYNGTATVSWITTNATSCNATGGSIGWAGAKSIGPGSFYTGSLTGTRTYTLTCNNNFGSANDSVTINVTGQTVINPVNPVTRTSLVLITSSVDRNQPIVPTIDNSRPHPGDEINYTVSYQNVGTGSITGLTLQINLPSEVDYLFSTPNNPIVSGQTLIFNLGTLKANGQGTVTARVRVRDDIPANTNLNFPATLSYINPSGMPQSVTANVQAQVWSEPVTNTNNSALGAGVFGSGVFLPVDLLGWLVLIILILALVFLSKYTYRELKK